MAGRHAKQQRTPLGAAERIYASLKASIIDFKLKPGHKLTEAELGVQFKASRTPAREALQRLARERLVRSVPREGYFVRAFDLDEIDRYYEARTPLEVLSVQLATPRMPSHVLEGLQEFWREPSGAISRVDSERLVRRDEAFHETIAAQSGNPILLRFLREINQHIRIIRRLDYLRPELIRRSFADHAAVLAKIAKKEADEAAALMREHIHASRTRTKALAEERLAAIYH
jgi:DNA-binding GntR family transcriptional regulator